MIVVLLLLYVAIFIPVMISIYNLGTNKKKKVKELKRFRNIEIGDTVQLKSKETEIPSLANKLFEVKKIIELKDKKYAILYDYSSDVTIRRNIEKVEKVY